METPRAIGKYEILERIGETGFGVAYEARDPLTGRLVVLKVCTSEDETLRRRFLREAEIAGDLHHRNVATVFELDHDDAGAFLVQEHLDGEDLEAKLRRREPIPQEVRLGYLLQVARALEYAHKKGILHRDLRPANVRVLPDDRIKILDFGVAQLSGAETQLTRTGSVPGAAGYLSPEQIEGSAVDARSDVFSFGILAYELLSSVHPFPGTALAELLDQVVRADLRPLASVCPGCPPEVVAMVTRCLEKDPSRRYDGFSQVAEALASALAGRREAPAGAPREGARPSLTAAGEPEPIPHPLGASATGLPSDPEATLFRPASAPSPPAPTETPAEDDLEATQEIPLEPDEENPRTRRWTVAAAVLAACVLVALLAVWLGWRRPALPAEEAARAGSRELEPVAAPPTGRLLVDAAPWGEVVRVRDAQGREVELPPERSTPLALDLPAGRYTVELSHPEVGDPASCSAEVAAGGSARCAVLLHRLDARDYFREAGWWR